MNFIQQYADYDAKTRVMSFATQWPAKLEGKITLESKSGATDPTKGGFSFKLANTSPKTTLDQPNELGVGLGDETGSEQDFKVGAEKIAKGIKSNPVTKAPSKMGDVGRKLRKV
jgi:hypothetical protein